MRYVTVFLIGAVFGTGIVLSGMANPAKVLNFFDLAGTFDPSLIFVMAGALSVAVPGYALIFRRRQKPVFGETFVLPKAKLVDRSSSAARPSSASAGALQVSARVQPFPRWVSAIRARSSSSLQCSLASWWRGLSAKPISSPPLQSRPRGAHLDVSILFTLRVVIAKA